MKPVGYLVNTKSGLEGEAGVFYNYIMAEDGLFIQARNNHLAATACISPQLVRGLLPLGDSVELLHGKIPMCFLNLALSVLCIKPDIEQYLALTWQDNYSLGIPSQTQTAASVTYETLPDTVLDFHSHVGGVPPHFSGIDDHDEQGFCLHAVAGDFHNLFPTVELRLGVYGYFMPLNKEDIFL
jgi:hypothetical protein